MAGDHFSKPICVSHEGKRPAAHVLSEVIDYEEVMNVSVREPFRQMEVKSGFRADVRVRRTNMTPCRSSDPRNQCSVYENIPY
jgi:hypothetical protein